ncbi:MAG: tyrosine--tRNA ligase [Gemmatimonadaceae bacterium]
MNSLLAELTWRGLLYQHTEPLDAALTAGVVTGYCGFDPTATSLHVGNLVPVMGLAHLQRAGHRPIVLIGGGTGMIGDPSGKTAERQLNTPETVEQNSRAIQRQLEKFLVFGEPSGAIMRDNAEWLLDMQAVEFMREVGKHFTVSYMMQKDSVRSRMEEGGISYTEFSYMLLQAKDFLELYRRVGCTLQIGGSDQWGNITAGIELLRRVEGVEAHALTMPLVTTAAGTKFGKTEAGAVWLDPALTSPYRFYQFWVNVDDRDASRFLRFFTLMGREEIEALELELAAHPERRVAQQALARDVTTRVHGEKAAKAAADASAMLFGSGDRGVLTTALLVTPDAFEMLKGEVPYVEIAKPSSMPMDTLDLFVRVKLASSRGNAKRLREQGGLYLNGRRVGLNDSVIDEIDLVNNRYLLLRKGARDYTLVKVLE